MRSAKPLANSWSSGMPISLPNLNAALLHLAKHYAIAAQKALGDNLVSIALYGSVARGKAGPASDIDLFAVLRRPHQAC